MLVSSKILANTENPFQNPVHILILAFREQNMTFKMFQKYESRL
jgi:hypothetical protein